MPTLHFSDQELACKHCIAIGNYEDRDGAKPALFSALEQLRTAVGLPIRVTSGYRCPNHPETKKRPGSYHTKGLAADIRVVGMTAKELFEAAAALGVFHGLGYDEHENYVHVDVRPSTDGRVAKWRYGTDGQPIYDVA